VVLAIGGQHYVQMKQDIAAKLIERLPAALQQVESYADEAMDIRNTLVARMGQQMTAEEFECVLGPVFQQDEWKLIAVGAVLGFLSGRFEARRPNIDVERQLSDAEKDERPPLCTYESANSDSHGASHRRHGSAPGSRLPPQSRSPCGSSALA
jgi:hypothetical protein